MVNGQFTNKHQTLDTLSNDAKSEIDKDFWNDFDANDLTQENEENLDHLQVNVNGQ